jgi:hypothetical protein
MRRQIPPSFLAAARAALVFIALTAVRADTVTTASGTNTTIGTAQSISLAPDLVLNQIAPNYSLGTAQPVSPQFFGSDVFGSIASGTPNEFFGVNVAAGQNLDFQVSSTTPASQPTELLLYDKNGNLVAVASGNALDGVSSTLDFTIPGGDAGVWDAEVTSPISSSYNYDLRFTSPLSYSTDVLGSFPNAADSGYYSVSANVGDNLHFFVTSTGPTGQPVELFLYDPNGNLVAVAEGNAIDGVSSIIDFTVPGGDAGNWTAEVFDPTSALYKYDLEIQGATGTGPVNPLALATPEPSLSVFLGVFLAGLAFFRYRAATVGGREKMGTSTDSLTVAVR